MITTSFTDEKWPKYRDTAGWYLMPHKYHLALHFWWTALGTNDSFNDFMRVNKSDVANSQKKIISSGEKCNMFSKFWMAPLAHKFDNFSSEKNMFRFGKEVASPSLSVVSHKRNLLISVSLEWGPVCCTFCNHLSEPCCRWLKLSLAGWYCQWLSSWL